MATNNDRDLNRDLEQDTDTSDKATSSNPKYGTDDDMDMQLLNDDSEERL